MSKKVNIKKRNSIKKYIWGAAGFLVAMLFFKSEAKAAIFNSKTSDSHKLQIDGSDALSIDAQKNVTFGAGLKDANVVNPVTLGDVNNTEFNTTSQSIVWATNEVYDNTFPIPKLEIRNREEYTLQAWSIHTPKVAGIYYSRNQADDRFIQYTPKIYLLKRRKNNSKTRTASYWDDTSQSYIITTHKYKVKVPKWFSLTWLGSTNDPLGRQVIFDFTNRQKYGQLLVDKTELDKWFSIYKPDVNDANTRRKLATGRKKSNDTNQYFQFCIWITIDGKTYLGPRSNVTKIHYRNQSVANNPISKMKIEVL